MFVRLTTARRLRVGWFVALAYLLCVLTPTISLALPGSRAIASCLTDADHTPSAGHVHNGMPAKHVHEEGLVHDHSGAYSYTNFGDDHSISTALNSGSIPEKAPHSTDGQCCGLMCVTALPATLIDIVKPFAPTAVCDVESYRKMSNNAPPRLYRPPIS